jgi:hypothetical protein
MAFLRRLFSRWTAPWLTSAGKTSEGPAPRNASASHSADHPLSCARPRPSPSGPGPQLRSLPLGYRSLVRTGRPAVVRCGGHLTPGAADRRPPHTAPTRRRERPGSPDRTFQRPSDSCTASDGHPPSSPVNLSDPPTAEATRTEASAASALDGTTGIQSPATRCEGLRSGRDPRERERKSGTLVAKSRRTIGAGRADRAIAATGNRGPAVPHHDCRLDGLPCLAGAATVRVRR